MGLMGGKQLVFGVYEQAMANKRTKRKKFLPAMDQVVLWLGFIDLVELHYPKSSKKGGRPAYPLVT